MIDIALDNARIHATYEGDGAPELVLVHGFGCTHADWRHQIARFRRERRVLAMDLRGHGVSTGRAPDCTLEQLGKDVAALLHALDLGTCVLVGHSMGCRVVLEAYAHAAQRIAGVILVDGSRLGMHSTDAARMRELIRSVGYPAFARSLFGEALLPATSAGQAVIERAARLRQAVGATLFPSLIDWDFARMERCLETVTVPLLAIQSTYLNTERKRVHLLPGQSSPWLDLVRSRARDARVEVVTEAGHFTMLDQPEAFNRLLVDFIRRLPGA